MKFVQVNTICFLKKGQNCDKTVKYFPLDGLKIKKENSLNACHLSTLIKVRKLFSINERYQILWQKDKIDIEINWEKLVQRLYKNKIHIDGTRYK